MIEGTASGRAERPLWAKLIMTVALPFLVGPLVGTVLVYLIDAASLLPQAISIYMQGQTMLSNLVSGYVVGGPQALICGVTFALVGWFCGGLPFRVPIVTGLFLAVIFALALFGVSGEGIFFSVVIHLVPALVAWWLVRGYWKRADA